MKAGCVSGTNFVGAEPTEMNGGRYTLTLELLVEDGARLWDAAAARYREGIGLSLAEVMETIGPREDPSIEDCLMTIALPDHVEGCTLTDFKLTPVESEEVQAKRATPTALSVQLRGYAPFQAPFQSPDPMIA